jgi:hypothetical protein
METKLSFSGHETFIVKHFWPKKGVDFLMEGNKFTDSDSVIKLGVGKNMVSSIRFWLKAIGLVDENEKPTELAENIFSDKGFDPYLEDIGTIWLLHFMLVKSAKASIYNLVFNELIREKTEFTRQNLHGYLKRIATDSNANTYNENTIKSDVNVFIRNYVKPKIDTLKSNSEDEFSGLFLDLELVNTKKQRVFEDSNVEEYLFLEKNERESLPKEIFLYAILSNMSGNTISFKELISGNNSVGNMFLLSKDGIYDKIQELIKSDYEITYTDSAGNQMLNFNKKLSPEEVIQAYYEND